MEIKKQVNIEITDRVMYDSFCIKQYDEGYPIEFVLTYNGKPADLSNVVAVLELKKPDGTISVTQCTIQKNLVSCNVTNQMTAVNGNAKFQLTLFDASTYVPDKRESAVVLSLMTGIMHIYESTVQNDDIKSESIISIIADVLVQLEEAKYTTQLCKSYAVGGTGLAGRENEDTDNAKYYCEQMQSLIDSIENGDEVKY